MRLNALKTWRWIMVLGCLMAFLGACDSKPKDGGKKDEKAGAAKGKDDKGKEADKGKEGDKAKEANKGT